MQIVIIGVGRSAPAPVQQLIDDYQKRLRSTLQLEWRLLPPAQHGTADEARRDESARIAALLRPGDVTVLLDERGQQYDNQQLAQLFDGWLGAQGRLVFVVGGAFGVDEQLRAGCRYVWSFSKLVFPHEIVWLLLTEQLYRTVALRTGHPYHHV